jgi:pyruvate dehydrogenase E2 component (dihydrolipoamide acetyltransferase)
MSELIEVRVPDMGNFKDVAVIDVLVKPGDSIATEAPLLTLETEKATMDVPSSAAGVIERVHVEKGGRVNAGDVIASVRAADAQPVTPPSAAQPTETTQTTETPKKPEPAPVTPSQASESSKSSGSSHSPQSTAHASPSVRRFGRELGVRLEEVKGTGFKGRITHDDVKAHVKRALTSGGAPATARGGPPSVPAIDYAQYGPVETRPLSRIQRISGPRVHASWVNIPHVTQFDEADITELEELRLELKQTAQQKGIKLTVLAFVLRACVRALQQFREFDASLDASGENLILKKYMHIGFAADTPQGLLVPVVRDADRKDIYEIARALGELSEKARSGKISAAEMQGGCFTISSLGGIGGTAFTPIINAPEVAILGVSRSTMRPVFREGGFIPRLMLPLSLSYDHRVIDGATAVRFTTFLVEAFANPKALVEAVP